MVNWLNIHSPNNDKLIVSILVDKYLFDFGFIKRKFNFRLTNSKGLQNVKFDSPVLLYYLDGCNGVLCVDNEYLYLYTDNGDGTFSICANVKYLTEQRYDLGNFELLIEKLIISNYNNKNSN